jgi:hypothetical protein
MKISVSTANTPLPLPSNSKHLWEAYSEKIIKGRPSGCVKALRLVWDGESDL